MTTRTCMSTETVDGTPCRQEVDIHSGFCEAGHLCVVPAVSASFSSPPTGQVLLGEQLPPLPGDEDARLNLTSPSAADDGRFVAMADVALAARRAGVGDDYRFLGGIAVMLHVQRLGLDIPLRETRDADLGIPPHVLRSGRLVEELEGMHYEKTSGSHGASARSGRRLEDG
ncbi:MAG TPA: hypothetical protein VNF07_11465 [Acidimicrobiales bacterium]|nr:hypothetical protein [Acidimicrobiales bacterium]